MNSYIIREGASLTGFVRHVEYTGGAAVRGGA